MSRSYYLKKALIQQRALAKKILGFGQRPITTYSRLDILDPLDSQIPAISLTSVHMTMLDNTVNYLNLIESRVHDLYMGNAYTTLYDLYLIYKLNVHLSILTHLAEQHSLAAEKCVGNWDESIGLLNNFLEKAGAISDYEPIQAAWRIFNMGTSIQHLTATLICLFSPGIVLGNSMSQIHDYKIKYLYRVIPSKDQPWLIETYRKGIVRDVEDLLRPTVEGQFHLWYDWTSLAGLLADYESDCVMNSLASLN